MYKTKYFRIEELVPEDLFGSYGDALWGVFDSRILKAADMLRKQYGKMTINTWLWDGDEQHSGFRYFNYPEMHESYCADKSCSPYIEKSEKCRVCNIGKQIHAGEIGESLSQHKFGRALDLSPLETTAEAIREDSRSKAWQRRNIGYFSYITAIGCEPDWLHIDCRNSEFHFLKP